MREVPAPGCGEGVESETEADREMTDAKVFKHESYGMVGISHISSTGTILAGSEFKHHHFVELTIRRAERHRDLSRDWWFGREELISIFLSEAQYVELMGRPNMGEGVPCTLNHVMGARMEAPPPPEPRKSQGHSDLEKTAAKASDAMKEALAVVEEALASGKVGKKQLEKMAFSLKCQIENFAPNMKYVVDSFDEAMNATVAKAGIEIEATVSNLALRLGIGEMRRLSVEGPRLIEGGEAGDIDGHKKDCICARCEDFRKQLGL